MRVQIERIEQAVNNDGTPDGFQSQGGFIPAYKFEGRIIEGDPTHRISTGEYGFFKANFKKPPSEGSTENFDVKTKKGTNQKISFPDGNLPDGGTLWRVVVARAQDMSRGGNPYNGSNSAPQAPRTPANAPQGHSRTSSTVTERGQLLATLIPRGVKLASAVAPAGATPDGILQAAISIAMHMVIGLDRGDIRPDPTAAEVEAAEAAKQARLEEAKRLLAEQEAKSAKATIEGYAPTDGPDDEIPF